MTKKQQKEEEQHVKKVAIQEQEEAAQMARHAETLRELENQLLKAQEELMAEAGEQKQAYRLKEELSEQKDAAHTVTEELAEA